MQDCKNINYKNAFKHTNFNMNNKSYRMCFLLTFKLKCSQFKIIINLWLNYSFCLTFKVIWIVALFIPAVWPVTCQLRTSAVIYTQTRKHTRYPSTINAKVLSMSWCYGVQSLYLSSAQSAEADHRNAVLQGTHLNNFVWPCTSLNNTVKLIQLVAIKEPSYYLHSTSN